MSTIEIYKQYTFDSAHYLTKVPADHPCSNVHGHTYTLIITLQGLVDQRGFVLDYHEMDAVIKPVIAKYDHKLLNEFVENPTCENLIMQFYKELQTLPLMQLELKETQKTGAIWRVS